LRPVRRRLGVQRRDRRLHLVRAGAAPPERGLEERLPILDPLAVESRAVLLLEQDGFACLVHARLAPGVVQEDQRKQPRRLGLVAAGTRKARALSPVVRPPSSRSVSATCASTPSAGWQHVKISASRSSGIELTSSSSCSPAGSEARRASASRFPASTRSRRS